MSLKTIKDLTLEEGILLTNLLSNNFDTDAPCTTANLWISVDNPKAMQIILGISDEQLADVYEGHFLIKTEGDQWRSVWSEKMRPLENLPIINDVYVDIFFFNTDEDK